MKERKRPSQLALLCMFGSLCVGCDRTSAPGSVMASGTVAASELASGATGSSDTEAANPTGASDSAPAAIQSTANRPLLISFDDLQPDRYPQPDAHNLPKEIDDLRGKRVRIRGYMLPALQQSHIGDFVLVRDNLQCCFGMNVNPFDCIMIRLDANQSIEYDIDPITVDGVFDLEEDTTSEFPIFYSIKSAKAWYAY